MISHSIGAATGDEVGRLVGLVGSRICHDLANPLGAIANGIELLGLTGAEPGSAEMALVAGSVTHAAARLRFLRVAFGAARAGQVLGRAETGSILADLYRGSRLRVGWEVPDDLPRAETRLAFLLLQCVETALPRGGEVRAALAQERWRIEAKAERIREVPALWPLLAGGALPETLRPAEVQFALAPHAAAALGRRIRAEAGPAAVIIEA